MCAPNIVALFITTFDFHIIVPPTSVFVQAFLLLLFCSKFWSNFARRLQQDSAAFVTVVSCLFSCFLSGLGPVEHLFLS